MEKQKLEEERRRKRRKEVEAATAQAKKKKKELAERKEYKARVAAEEYNLFLVRTAEREQMLAEEAKAQLVKKSEEADRARMTKAEKDWQELQEKESAEGVPLGAPALSYRSVQADRSREALESVGNLRDWWNEASLEKGHWFDSDLCILEPIDSKQMAVFEQLKITGLLCSRFSATIKKGGGSSPWQKVWSCPTAREARGRWRPSNSRRPARRLPPRMGGAVWRARWLRSCWLCLGHRVWT